MIDVISLGAGVQSTTVLLMAAAGELSPMPRAAVFADVGDEPAATYDYLRWLQSLTLPFPIVATSRGHLSKDFIAGDKMARPPFYVKTARGSGMLRRQCTRNYKIRQVRKAIRTEVLAVSPRAFVRPGLVSCWIGISTDEAARAKPANVKWLENRHPLLEKNMSREDCVLWLKAHNFPVPPKSSCVFCPYRSEASFARMREEAPGDFANAVALDRALRSGPVQKRNNAACFVLSSCVPLEDAKLNPSLSEPDQFVNECEGMCGQ